MQQNRNKQGIALVIVLGLLSVLIIFAVAFSISMRTERMATRSFLDVVRTRQLVHTAINRVIGEHIAAEMEGLDRVYPEFDAFTAALPPNHGDSVAILENDTLQSPFVFVPRSLRFEAATIGITNGVPWLPLLDPTLSPNDPNAFQGEYAFLVVNNSGLLDANVIGDREHLATPRERGFDPGEIRFHPSVLPEVRTAESLRLYRSAFRRFDSLPELYFLTSSDGGGNPQNPDYTDVQTAIGPLPTYHAGPGGVANPPRFVDNLHVFSRYPRGYAEIAPDGAWAANINVAYIGGSTNWIIAEITDAIDDLPIPDVDAFIGVMADYVATNYVLYPGELDPDAQFNRISSMRVPMVNEISISNQFLLTQAILGDPDSQHTLRHRIFLTVETWYPFPDADGAQFQVQHTAPDQLVVFTQPDPALAWPELSAANAYILEDTTYDPPLGPGAAGFVATPNSYQLTQFVYEASRTAASAAELPAPPAFEYNYILDVNIGELRVHYMGVGNPPVDRVLPWPTFDLDEELEIQFNIPASLGRVGASVNDPRINWDPEPASGQWTIGDPPTLGSFNQHTVSGGNTDERPTSGDTGPRDGRMFSKRGPFQSVGELGYLLYDETQPWTTVPLLSDSDITKLIDRLTVYPETSRRGMVNVNSRQTNALMAAIWQMPIDQFPSDDVPGGNWITDSMAHSMAVELKHHTMNNAPIANLSELHSAWSPDFINTMLTAYDAADNKFIRESVIRNSLGLLGTRHNLFTIFVAARTYTDDYDHTSTDHRNNRDDYVLADQRAVAVVWRDPLRTRDTHGFDTYQTWMHFFLWETGAIEVE